jgi:hypothetical protein
MSSLMRAICSCSPLLLLGALPGCGGGGQAAPTGRFGDLTFTATTDKAVYAPGETVRVSLTVTNGGRSDVRFSSVTWPLKLSVRRGAELVFSTPPGGTANNLGYTIPAGGSLILDTTWDQRDYRVNELTGTQVPSGIYAITAWLNTYAFNDVYIGSTDLENTLGARPVTITIL